MSQRPSAQALAILVIMVLAPAAPCLPQPYFDAPWRAFASDESSAGPGRYLVDVTEGDLNGDDLTDVIAAQAIVTGGVRVFLNLGAAAGPPATFAAPAFYPTANGVWGVAAADLDGDGDLDVAATSSDINFQARWVAILLNAGDGTLGAPAYFAAGPFGPAGITAADLDGDQDVDLAVTNYGFIGQGTAISVLLNHGDATFATPISHTVAPAPFKIEAGDLDLDGVTDLAVAHDAGAAVSVLLGDGTGRFGTPIEISNIFSTVNTGVNSAVALLDPDADGDLDIAYTSSFAYNHQVDDGELALLRNHGAASFTIDYYRYQRPFKNVAFDLAPADLNGDGFDDVVGAQFFEAGFLSFLADGAGGFLPPRVVASADDVLAIAAPDLDADGDSDVVTVNRLFPLVGAHDNPGDGSFAVLPASGAVFLHSVVDMGDVNGDGRLDAVTSHSGASASTVNVFLAGGDGTFTQSYVTPSAIYAFAKLRDLDGDDNLDLLFVTAPSVTPYDFFTARGNGDGTFQTVIRWPIGTCGNAHPGAFDVDHDGDLDVINTEDRGCPGPPLSGRRLFISRNNGNGTFQPAYTVEAGSFPRNVAAGDFDEDGNLDLATTGATDALLFGNGDGTFQPWQPLPLDISSDNLLVGDWDGDDHLDLAARSLVTSGVTALAVLWGNGAGGFSPSAHGDHPGPTWRPVLTTGDLDRDGDLDVMMDGVQDALIFVNQGGRAFEGGGRYGIGRDARAVHFADANDDSIGDLVALVTLETPPAGLEDGLVVLPGTAAATAGLDVANPPAVPRRRGYTLSLVTPNPFNPRARYTLQLEQSQYVTVTLYDALGRRVRRLHAGWLAAGVQHRFELDGLGLASGVYLLQVHGATFAVARRAVLLR